MTEEEYLLEEEKWKKIEDDPKLKIELLSSWFPDYKRIKKLENNFRKDIASNLKKHEKEIASLLLEAIQEHHVEGNPQEMTGWSIDHEYPWAKHSRTGFKRIKEKSYWQRFKNWFKSLSK